MPKYDIENLLEDVQALLVANLNTQIAAIESEKEAAGKQVVAMTPVDSASYYEQNWSDKILNTNPSIFYGIEQVQAMGAGPATGEVLKVFVEIICVDTQADLFMTKRINRYTRAIKEVFEANYDRLAQGSNKLHIETVRPVSFKLDMDASEEIHVGGVSLITAIA